MTRLLKIEHDEITTQIQILDSNSVRAIPTPTNL